MTDARIAELRQEREVINEEIVKMKIIVAEMSVELARLETERDLQELAEKRGVSIKVEPARAKLKATLKT